MEMSSSSICCYVLSGPALAEKCVQLLLSQNLTGTNEYNLKHENI